MSKSIQRNRKFAQSQFYFSKCIFAQKQIISMFPTLSALLWPNDILFNATSSMYWLKSFFDIIGSIIPQVCFSLIPQIIHILTKEQIWSKGQLMKIWQSFFHRAEDIMGKGNVKSIIKWRRVKEEEIKGNIWAGIKSQSRSFWNLNSSLQQHAYSATLKLTAQHYSSQHLIEAHSATLQLTALHCRL